MALSLMAAVRVVATYRVFSQTVDEPIHIAAGYQWLTTDRYDSDPEHPPLARIGFAFAAWLRNENALQIGDRVEAGNELLLRDGRYRTNLALARAGNLPWLLLAVAIVGVWSLRLFGPAASLLAIAFLSAMPPILGHAGLATTDMAVAASVTAALFCYAWWLRAPAWRNAILLAVAIAVGLLSKFSFPLFFAAGAVAFTAGHLRRPSPLRIAQTAVIACIAACGVWAFYDFSFGRLHDVHRRIYPPESPEGTAARYAEAPGYEWVRGDLIERYRQYGRLAEAQGVINIDFVDWARIAGYPSPNAGRHGNTMAGAPPIPPLSFGARIAEPFRNAWQKTVMRVPLPAPWFIAGFEYVRWHATGPHPAFLLGRHSDRGWWYYFPVVFFFKTPLPFLALSLSGAILLFIRSTRDWNGEAFGIAAAPVLMFVPSLFASLNIGVRHILTVYPLLCIGAAVAVVTLWRAGAAARAAALVFVAWYFIGTSVAHPDYLAWFNECAGRHPERIAVDSNLDWGQDLLRVRQAMRRHGIEELPIAYFGSIDPQRLGINATVLPPHERRRGWIAASEMRIAFGRGAFPDDYAWLGQYEPVERIGHSIRLYRIP